MSSPSQCRSPSLISLSPEPVVIRAGRRLFALAGAVARWWHARRRRALDRDILMSMNARELQDLGLGRDEIHGITVSRRSGRRSD
jgi:uncharacterized protein YjiS (DUF1127 family)